MTGEKQAAFDFADLNGKDRAELAQLVAKYRPDSKEALAAAGVYSEISGNTRAADAYYEKAGSEVKAAIDKLFE